MMSRFFVRSRKGDSQFLFMVIEFAIGALLVTYILSYLILKVVTGISSSKDDGSHSNFENKLYFSLREMMQNTQSDYRIMNYFIGSDKILVGFDTEWDENKAIISKSFADTIFFRKSNLFRPFACGTAACLCLYTTKIEKGSSNKRDEGVIDCKSDIFAGKKVVFSAEGGDVTPKTAGLKRDYGLGNYLFLNGADWKVQRLYVEKTHEGGKYSIYISKIDEDNPNDPAAKRKNLIDSKSA